MAVSKRVIRSMSRMRYRFVTPQTVQYFDELDDKLAKIDDIKKQQKTSKHCYYVSQHKMDDAVLNSPTNNTSQIDGYPTLSKAIDEAGTSVSACNLRMAELWNDCSALVVSIEDADNKFREDHKNTKRLMQRATIGG